MGLVCFLNDKKAYVELFFWVQKAEVMQYFNLFSTKCRVGVWRNPRNLMSRAKIFFESFACQRIKNSIILQIINNGIVVSLKTITTNFMQRINWPIRIFQDIARFLIWTACQHV